MSVWLVKRLVALRMFLLLVVAPTVLAAAYLWLFMADLYVSEARFVVRTGAEQSSAPSGLGSVLGLTGALTPGQSDAMSVVDYLQSLDAMGALRKSVPLVEVYRRPEADVFSKLRYPNPEPERLHDYYLGMVAVRYNSDTSITTLSSKAFRPQDAKAITTRLLELAEQRINVMNQRSSRDSVELARAELKNSEAALSALQANVTNFRQRSADINPAATGQLQSQMVTGLRASLAQAEAQLEAMQGVIASDSPQQRALRARVAALRNQVGQQAGNIAGSDNTIAVDLGGYEKLVAEQKFAEQRYISAAAQYERARENALKQQLYLSRVVEPNLPVKSTLPERWKIIATIAAALLMLYWIGALLASGMREHVE